MKENLFLLKNLLERWKTKILSPLQLFQKKFILMCKMILLVNTITQFIEALKWNRLTLHLVLILNAIKILIKNILNLKLAIILGLQNTKISLLRDTLQIGQKKFLLLAKWTIQSRGHLLLMIWMVIWLLEVFIKKNAKN